MKKEFSYLFVLCLVIVSTLIINGCVNEENKSVYLGHKNFARFELPQEKNECNNISNCIVGGCSGETCTAYESKITTCEVPEGMLRSISCRCIGGECIWVKE